jgi:cell division protein FtsL
LSGNRRGASVKRTRGSSWFNLVRRSPNRAAATDKDNIEAGTGWSANPRRGTGARLGPGYLLLLTLVILLVTAAFLVHLYIRFEGVRLGYETNRARATRTRLLLERRELRLELASLKSPARVETEARERLGMEIPDHRRIVPVGRKRKSITVSGGAL